MLSDFFAQIQGLLKYAAKAAVAALTPVVTELIDNFIVAMSDAAQGALTAGLAAVAVYFTKNNYDAAPVRK